MRHFSVLDLRRIGQISVVVRLPYAFVISS
jgi:hypothetical protein